MPRVNLNLIAANARRIDSPAVNARPATPGLAPAELKKGEPDFAHLFELVERHEGRAKDLMGRGERGEAVLRRHERHREPSEAMRSEGRRSSDQDLGRETGIRNESLPTERTREFRDDNASSEDDGNSEEVRVQARDKVNEHGGIQGPANVPLPIDRGLAEEAQLGFGDGALVAADGNDPEITLVDPSSEAPTLDPRVLVDGALAGAIPFQGAGLPAGLLADQAAALKPAEVENALANFYGNHAGPGQGLDALRIGDDLRAKLQTILENGGKLGSSTIQELLRGAALAQATGRGPAADAASLEAPESKSLEAPVVARAATAGNSTGEDFDDRASSRGRDTHAAQAIDAASRSEKPAGTPARAAEMPSTFRLEDGTDSTGSRLGRVLLSRLRGGERQFQLVLQPPQLGNLKVQMTMKKSSVSVSFKVESRAVRHSLNSRSSELRAVLEEAGLDVEDIRVEVADLENDLLGGQPAETEAEDAAVAELESSAEDFDEYVEEELDNLIDTRV